MAENYEVDGIEIPDELLDALAGGCDADVPKGQIITLIRVVKALGHGIDHAEKWVRAGADGSHGFFQTYDADEAVEYLKGIWDET